MLGFVVESRVGLIQEREPISWKNLDLNIFISGISFSIIKSQHPPSVIKNKITFRKIRSLHLLMSEFNCDLWQILLSRILLPQSMLQNNPDSICSSACQTFNSQGASLKDIQVDIKSSWPPLNGGKEAKFLHS